MKTPERRRTPLRDHQARHDSRLSVITSDAPAGSPRSLLDPSPHRARAHRHRHGRRVSRRRAARAARSGRADRPRRRAAASARVGAMFAAVDGGQRLWDREGLWKQPAIAPRLPLALAAARRGLGAGRRPWRLLAVPLALFGDRRARRRSSACCCALVSLTGASTAVTAAYGARARRAVRARRRCRPSFRASSSSACSSASARSPPASRCSAWRAPARRRSAQRRDVAAVRLAALERGSSLDRAVAELWNLIRGAAAIAPPARAGSRPALHRAAGREPRPAGIPRAAARRARHGRAARRAVRAARRRPPPALLRPRAADGGTRQAEAFDLAGVGREHVMDALAANLAMPVATDPHLLRFPVEGPWRGETHRLCDRPGRARAAARRSGRRRRRAGHRRCRRRRRPGRPHELSSARARPPRPRRGAARRRSRPPISATRWSAPPAASPASS